MTATPWEGSPRPPRRWQAEALPVIGAALRRGERPVVRAATGTGKAQLISEICALFAETLKEGEAIVVVTPRQALVEQLSGLERLAAGAPLRPGSVAWRMGVERVGVYFGRKKLIKGRQVIVTCNPSLQALAVDLAAEGRKVRLLVVDEAHRSESEAIIAALELLAPPRIVGFTATPWRTGKDETLSIFTGEAVSYGIGPAIADGVLVPWETITWEGGEIGIDEACAQLIVAHGVGPGIVSAMSIDDATAFAGYLRDVGISAEPIHSGQTPAAQAALVARLLAGELRCLVHVSLLTEGTDIPELRWLCMRRPSATAIRFVQELGRVLRSSPGKTRALLLDPYDHEGTIGIVHDSKIGEALDKQVEMEARGAERKEGSGDAPATPMPPPVAVSALTRWARQTVMALLAAGLSDAPLKGRRWRSEPASERQVQMLTGYNHPIARVIGSRLTSLSRGEASDLIGALTGLRRARGATLPDMPAMPEGAIKALKGARDA